MPPEIVRHLTPPTIVAELGSGSGRKTRWILEALARRDYTRYYPIDVSAAALHACRNELGGLDSGPHRRNREHVHRAVSREVIARAHSG